MNLTLQLDLSKILTPKELRNLTLNLLPSPQGNGVSITKQEFTHTASTPKVQVPEGGWEYAPKVGHRRNKTEIALHKKELELGRLLTPEEKGKTNANVELDDEKEAEAKKRAKKDAHIQELVDESIAAVTTELSEESNTEETSLTSEDNADDVQDEIMPGKTEEATIPETKEVNTNSLFL